jgi:glutathione peroxidase-family protein
MDVFNTINRFNYQVNVNHPEVQPVYQAWKRSKGIPQMAPPSDEERWEFDRYFISRYKPADGER